MALEAPILEFPIPIAVSSALSMSPSATTVGVRTVLGNWLVHAIWLSNRSGAGTLPSPGCC